MIIVEQNLLIPQDISVEKETLSENDKNNNKIYYNNEKMDIYYDFRKELQTIYQNFFSIKCLKPFIIQSIELKFETLLKDYFSYTLQDLELPIQLLSIVKESIKENDDTVTFKSLISNLFKMYGVLRNISSDAIIILYFETITKYIFVYSKDQDIIKEMLDIFFGNK